MKIRTCLVFGAQAASLLACMTAAEEEDDTSQRPDEVTGSEPSIAGAEEAILRGEYTAWNFLPAVSTPGSFCSAVAITRRHLLTAAHCLPQNNRTCGWTGAESQPCSTGDVTVYLPTTLGARSATTFANSQMYRHSAFAEALGNFESDVGVIALPPNTTHGALPMAISLRSATKGQVQYVFGAWGRSSLTTNDYGRLREPPGNGDFNVDSVKTGYYIDTNDDDVNLCKGDSGSPAFVPNPLNLYAIQGIASSVEIGPCREAQGEQQRWMDVGYAGKMSWIINRLKASGFACPVASTCCHRDSGQLAARCEN